MADRWSALPRAFQDALVAGAFAIVWFTFLALAQDSGWYPADSTAYQVIGLWCGLVLLIRHRWPLTTLLLATLVYPPTSSSPWTTGVELLPILLAGYTATSTGRVKAVIALPLTVLSVALSLLPVEWVLSLLGTASRDPGRAWDQVFREIYFFDGSRVAISVGATAAVILLGATAHRQKATAETLAARNAELERLRTIEATQIVNAERSRIARELHDVVAHHVSAMVLQAQAAGRVAGRDPQAPRAAVDSIAREGQQALTAMRHVVRVLHDGPGGDHAPLAPEPTVRDLPEIVERVRRAGLDTGLRVAELPELPAAVDLACLRIAQEALTNVLLHAHATRAEVVLEVIDGSRVLVRVDDDGRSVPVGQHQAGHGLRGMAERARSVGGDVAIGPSPLGGWRVEAALPLDSPASTPTPATPVTAPSATAPATTP